MINGEQTRRILELLADRRVQDAKIKDLEARLRRAEAVVEAARVCVGTHEGLWKSIDNEVRLREVLNSYDVQEGERGGSGA